MADPCWSFRVFFFSSRRRHTRFDCDWSSDVCSSDLIDDRIQALDALLRKHAPGGCEEDLLRRRDQAGEELSQLGGGGETVEDLQERVEELAGEALGAAAELSRGRPAAARALRTTGQTE